LKRAWALVLQLQAYHRALNAQLSKIARALGSSTDDFLRLARLCVFRHIESVHLAMRKMPWTASRRPATNMGRFMLSPNPELQFFDNAVLRLAERGIQNLLTVAVEPHRRNETKMESRP
jgi:hypothetical protein